MRRFKKKAEIGSLYLPKVGHLAEGQLLEGDQYAQYVPEFLVEVLPSSPPVLMREPAPAPAPSQILQEPVPAREMLPPKNEEPKPPEILDVPAPSALPLVEEGSKHRNDRKRR